LFFSVVIPYNPAIRGWIMSNNGTALKRIFSHEFGRPINIQLCHKNSYHPGVDGFVWQWCVVTAPDFHDAQEGAARLLNFYFSCMKDLKLQHYPLPHVSDAMPLIVQDPGFNPKVDWANVTGWWNA
jgi:hypothetical protein